MHIHIYIFESIYIFFSGDAFRASFFVGSQRSVQVRAVNHLLGCADSSNVPTVKNQVTRLEFQDGKAKSSI